MKVAIRASKIQPRLHNHQWAQTARLSTDGFCDNPAMLNLSHDLCMGLHSGKVTLSYRALAEVGLTTRQAWDQSATNLLKCATTPEGIRFDLRDAETTTTIASSALEIRVPGAPITAWLAHPQTFTVLNRHLELRLGPAPLYLAPNSHTLIAIPAGDPQIFEFERWARSLLEVGGVEGIVDKLLVYRHGFPCPYQPAFVALAA
ncbi:hypothetical protein [Corynebacterium glutamicum]|uniref:hypothetical protein n=1 Tax=Corynebacterium glutamicum TaxID=1718 RepID=UPI00117E5817|nr:hypothetical protein [Corynebacterium glutamicum]QDQ21307.1 hypothetical protein FOL53_11455 [Corynebacterium glutamicum]QDQ22345.1 hypothetical protein FOY32_01425 [Corynebacterium glutamicum]